MSASVAASQPSCFGEITLSCFHRNFCLGPVKVSARPDHRIEHYWLYVPAEALPQIGDEAETFFVSTSKIGVAGVEGTLPMRMCLPGDAVEDETGVHLLRQLQKPIEVSRQRRTPLRRWQERMGGEPPNLQFRA